MCGEYDAVLGTIKKGSVGLWPVYLPKLTNLICINAGTCFINGILKRRPSRKWLHYPDQARTNGSAETNPRGWPVINFYSCSELSLCYDFLLVSGLHAFCNTFLAYFYSIVDLIY